MENIKELFEKETRLKLKETCSFQEYYEISGVSHQIICNKISNFNMNHDTNIYATNDEIKDITTIHF